MVLEMEIWAKQRKLKRKITSFQATKKQRPRSIPIPLMGKPKESNGRECTTKEEVLEEIVDWYKDLFSANQLGDNDRLLQEFLKWRRDRFILVKEKSGNFSVKSCYNAVLDRKKMKQASPESSTGAVIKKKMWTTTWNLQVKPKLKVFLWRCIHNSLPVAEKLNIKGIISSPLCCFCGENSENQTHIFFHCERAQIVWKLFPVQWDDAHIKADNFLAGGQTFAMPLRENVGKIDWSFQCISFGGFGEQETYGFLKNL
ncbi:RNA-directed DNA polymerase (reversetranscriptase)-related family protein [Striga asiatica]|uniref:RNA-directed DNA polymerase (Reversetranscriptase)-related family protein n=1 Tax=Striga asiatica TaxID=4170 RepID=A0A5A7R2R3_STRAF|nr:RNA-directed DNA polymerase (reversetranscriptase)-related family protein [Striga asiatica]